MISATVGLSYPGFYSLIPAPPSTAPPVYIATLELPELMPEVPYLATLEAQGGEPPYSFALKAGSGALPPGLTLTPEGVISGTAPMLAMMTPSTLPPALVDANYHWTLAVTDLLYPFTVRVNDSIGQIDEQAYQLELWENPTSYALLAGTLPGCLSFGGGAPMKVGQYPITVQAMDVDGRVLTRNYTLTVLSRPTS